MICFSMLNQDLGPDFLESRRESFTHPIFLEEFLHFLFGRVVLMQDLLDEYDFPLPQQTNELRRFGHHTLPARSPTGATKTATINIITGFRKL
jgi:hypothetical protein